MEAKHVEGTNEHAKENPEVKHEDGKVSLEGKTPEFSSAPSISSSSSSSSSSSLSEFDIGEKAPFDDSSVKYELDGNLSPGPESIYSPDAANHTPTWSMLSASPPVGIGLSPEASTSSPDLGIYSTGSQMKSPPTQTMGHPAGYDPNRIPASIFSTKVTNPSEWSVASNESLFSIHMGNNSFSRDNAVMLWKSGELPRLDEWNNSQSNLPYVSEAKSNEFSSLPASLPPVMEVPAHEESSVKSGNVSGLEEEDSSSNNSMKQNHAKENMTPAATKAPDFKGAPHAEYNRISSSTARTSTSNARLSEESGHSSSSFAFPVLVSDCGKTASLKGAVTEKPQLQEQVSKASSKPSNTKWFSWFSCWPRCC